MEELRIWLGAFFTLAAMALGVILVLIAVAMVIGFWPLMLLIAAGGLFALAKWAAGEYRD
jgi:hypothetical protein